MPLSEGLWVAVLTGSFLPGPSRLAPLPMAILLCVLQRRNLCLPVQHLWLPLPSHGH